MFAVVVGLVVTIVGPGAVVRPASGAPAPSDDVVIRWNKAFLAAVRASRLGPPMVSRALAITHTCMYDAWAAYDQKAVGTRLGDALRQPPSSRGAKNKGTAISFGAYRAAVDLFPGARASFDALMADLGLDPSNTSTEATTPAGVGNAACKAVLDFRHHDGANQLGDEPGGTPGVAYSDYTGYVPVNKPMDLRAPFDPTTVVNPDKWQPLTYVDGAGAVVTPRFLGAFWPRVQPFALSAPNQFRPAGPAKFGTPEFVSQARDLLELSANLTDRQKAIVEYWGDGPASETPPGHWNLLAQVVSERDSLGLNEDVKLFFVLNNAIFDAGIVSWDAKRFTDCVRPITAIRYLFNGQQVAAWGGPFQGTKVIDGGTWRPFQPSTFPTPPFGEYTSGHSTFSAAAAETLRRFTGSDHFGASTTIAAGSSKVEPGATPATAVTLSWPTFSAAADEAGLSRRLGGIHFTRADSDGRSSGRLVATEAWEKADALFKGTA